MGDVSAAKMFLFSLLNLSLFVDKTSDRARVQLFEFVRVADEITKYAWGTATLAWLYRQLGTTTRADIVGRAGCLHLLQSWIHEYFPHTQKFVAHLEPQREGEPLCGRWASTDAIASCSDGRDKRLAYYRHLQDSLESEDVTWLPFGTDPAECVPHQTFRGVIRFSDIAEHYDSMRVLRQFGYVQDVPDEVPWPSTCTRGCRSTYVVTWDKSHDGAWSCRGRWYISVMYRRCSEEEDVAPGYMQWYLDRTHPYILRTIAERADCSHELVRCTVDLMLLLDVFNLLQRIHYRFYTAGFRILDGLHPMLADAGGVPAETMEELCTRVHDIYVDFCRQRPPRPFYRDEDEDDE
ncbi:Protein MAIN-LIKE 2 [Linum grandiflorum]